MAPREHSAVVAPAPWLDVLLSVEEMRAADRFAVEAGEASYDLMRRAGAAVARVALRRLEPGRPVAVLCGPGNNGGDGFVAAACLAGHGADVRVVLCGTRAQLTGDAARAAAAWHGSVFSPADAALDRETLIIDALFGAGLSRPLSGEAAMLVESANASGAPIVAVDVPSGLDGDSGAAAGPVIRACETVTFFRAKPGHWLYPGRDLCGRLTVADIGIPAAALDAIRPQTRLATRRLAQARITVPSTTGHKYLRGHVIVVSGGIEGIGAARLAARAALRGGAGLVTLAVPGEALAAHAAGGPDALMVRRIDDAAGLTRLLSDPRIRAVVLGPALGVAAATRALVHAALSSSAAVALDADALTSFAGHVAHLHQAITARQAPTVLTPHEGEFGRLFVDLGPPGASKLDRARRAAAAIGAIVLLKGPDTVVAAPDGQAFINTKGTPWLATAGSGDVLAGVVAGLLGQGVPALEATAAAAWLHGAAGRSAGPGLIADDLPEALVDVIADLSGWSRTSRRRTARHVRTRR